ncbi:MAG: hypothetical protein IPP71_23970 [Bacteroidetes bacterium]|nr:hypothetical protein [Bacteroidota bacterium]
MSQNVNQEWFKEFSEKNERGDLRIKIDNEGFIYIAGSFDSDNNGIDWKLIKLNPGGDTIFNTTFNGVFNGDDFVNAIALDEENNIYLTGRFSAAGNQSSIATFKINNIGEIIWQVISTPTEGINEGLYILTDTIQNVFIGGKSGSLENSDVFLKNITRKEIWFWSYIHSSANK